MSKLMQEPVQLDGFVKNLLKSNLTLVDDGGTVQRYFPSSEQPVEVVCKQNEAGDTPKWGPIEDWPTAIVGDFEPVGAVNVVIDLVRPTQAQHELIAFWREAYEQRGTRVWHMPNVRTPIKQGGPPHYYVVPVSAAILLSLQAVPCDLDYVLVPAQPHRFVDGSVGYKSLIRAKDLLGMAGPSKPSEPETAAQS